MTAPAIRYHVTAPNPANHLAHVTMEVDGPDERTDLALPVWTPGSYMVRDFSRHIQDFRARDQDGRPLSWQKTRKDVWTIESGDAGQLRVDFDVYANDLTVRTSHLDSTHLFFNPANLLPYLPSRTGEPHALSFEVPEGWTVATGLAALADGDGFVAQDYDELVDSPVHAGPDPILKFEVRGIPHEVATWGRNNLDVAQFTADLAKIVAAQASLFDGLPYERYVFILMANDEGGGGLEHRNSCSLLVNRFAFRPGPTYERLLRLCSHEFFHTWNVKRIHPAALGPFNYQSENYTRSLWAVEGITDYYALLMLRRSGIISPERFLEVLGQWMSDLADTPGRNVQSLEEASFDAWIKYYRPDEHSVNSGVSYYLKGALASLLLDLEMWGRTGGERSLDDLMRLLWQRFGQTDQGVPENAYQGLVEEIAGGDWTAFFDAVIRGRGDLSYPPSLAAGGVEVGWAADQAGPEAWLGLQLRTEATRTRVRLAPADGPAFAAGFTGGDELLALDGFRVSEATLNDRLRDYHPGQTVTISVFRGDHLIEIPVTLAKRPATRATLKRIAEPTPLQEAIFKAWTHAQ
ncbi:MAG: M61 family peptidase [Chloroflexi bacterium]|nr:M61 family peptidase [Chloroflexota bacterium]